MLFALLLNNAVAEWGPRPVDPPKQMPLKKKTKTKATSKNAAVDTAALTSSWEQWDGSNPEHIAGELEDDRLTIMHAPESVQLSFRNSSLWNDWGGDTGLGDAYPACSNQRLLYGEKLPENKELYKVWHPTRAYGTPRMIDTLTQMAEDVSWEHPDADPIVIGDLSSKYGGKLRGHKSHRGGSDADIGIFWGDGRQHMIGFMNVTAKDFDAKTNWTMVKSLLNSGSVERILVDQTLVNALRRHVISTGELGRDEAYLTFPTSTTNSVWMRGGVVHHHSGHRHHFHVRTYCN